MPNDRVPSRTPSRSSQRRRHAYSTWLASRPRRAENEAIDLLLRLAREFDARLHIVHLASSDALPALRLAKRNALRVTFQTCPHYLPFAAEEFPTGPTQSKSPPPLPTPQTTTNPLSH